MEKMNKEYDNVLVKLRKVTKKQMNFIFDTIRKQSKTLSSV